MCIVCVYIDRGSMSNTEARRALSEMSQSPETSEELEHYESIQDMLESEIRQGKE